MKRQTLKSATVPFILAFSFLSCMTVISALTAQAQGRRGDESRSSGSQSRSSSSSRSGGESRSSSRSDRQTRERSSDNNTQSSSSDSSRSWTRHRDRDRDRDKDRDKDRDRHRDRDRDRKRNRERDRDEQARVYRNTTVYQSRNYGGNSSDAYNRGYQDGLFTGANDARRGQSYDPERSHFYRRGAPGFFSSFGYGGTDRDSYREGFLRGYEEGFYHYDTYFTGGRFHP
jgi:hypothetical protein